MWRLMIALHTWFCVLNQLFYIIYNSINGKITGSVVYFNIVRKYSVVTGIPVTEIKSQLSRGSCINSRKVCILMVANTSALTNKNNFAAKGIRSLNEQALNVNSRLSHNCRSDSLYI